MGPIIAVAVALIALDGYIRTGADAWAARGITPLKGWGTTRVAQIAAAAGVTVTLTVASGSTAPAPFIVSAAVWAWLAVLAVSTDLSCYRVPSDVIHVVAVIGMACAASHAWTQQVAYPLLSIMVGVVTAVGALFLGRIVTRGGLGMSDVRLAWAATTCLGWWVGPVWLLYGLLVAAVVQFVVRFAAVFVGWGRTVDQPTLQGSVLDGQGTPVSGVGGHLTQDTRTRQASGAPPRTRRELPFAPALIIGLSLCSGAALVSGSTSCLLFNPWGPCPI